MAEIFDHTIYQGDTFEWLVLIEGIDGLPLDMSGYTGATAGARGMIRKNPKAVDVLATFDIFTLNGSGVLTAISTSQYHADAATIASLEDDAVGSCYLLIRLDADVTAALPAKRLTYDIELEDTYGYVFKPYAGSFTVLGENTR